MFKSMIILNKKEIIQSRKHGVCPQGSVFRRVKKWFARRIAGRLKRRG